MLTVPLRVSGKTEIGEKFSVKALSHSVSLHGASIDYPSLGCGGSPDCFRVLGSSYARIGRIPVALFGMLAYFSAFTFATFAAFGYARARIFLIPTIGAMFLGTLWLLYVQAFLLHAYCRTSSTEPGMSRQESARRW